MYQQSLKPKVYIPNHLTTGSVTVEGASLSVYAGFVKQLDLMRVPKDELPEIVWLVDPTDYLRPIVFDLNSSFWSNPGKAGRIKASCG
jgi:hypothetical protein